MAEDPRNMPTAGDYAWAESRSLSERVDALLERLTKLEERLARLRKAVSDHLISSGASESN